MKSFSRFAALLCLVSVAAVAQNRTRFAGLFNAGDYAYGINRNVGPLRVDIGIAATGSQSITLAYGFIQLTDGTIVSPLSTNAPVTIGVGSNAETVTPSAVSCTTPQQYSTCSFTATFSNTHGAGDLVTSGTFGLQEAINAANAFGGGTVITDSSWIALGGAKSNITAVTSATPKVWIWDISGTSPTWYGKSGLTSAAYSSTNNDQVFQLTLAAGTATKTLSQTYTTAPQCVASYISGTATGILKTAPTTTTVVVTDSVSEANVVQVSCPGLVK